MVKVVQFGLGDIGRRLTKCIYERKNLSISAAIDPNPEKSGKYLGEVVENGELNIEIQPDIESVEHIGDADVAIISTISDFDNVANQIREIAGYGLDVITTCKELVYPWKSRPQKASKLDEYCNEHDVTCMGAGLNSGFMMDYLPSILTSVCREVDFVKVERVLDAGNRGKAFRDSAGVGLSPKQFEEKRDLIRREGLEDSLFMLADSLHFDLNKVDESLKPVKAEKPIENPEIRLKQGDVSGIEQVAYGFRNNSTCIELVFRVAVDEEPYDAVEIVGEPGFTSKIEGGINSEHAAPAVVINSIKSVFAAEAGLKTMRDVIPPSYSEMDQ